MEQVGVHSFYELDAQNGKCGPVGVAKLIHLWQFKDGAWKITRVISYDHGPAPKQSDNGLPARAGRTSGRASKVIKV
jgi:hypothetical protein